MKSYVLEDLETQELIDKLREGGLGKLVDTLINNEDKCYTKRGRMNKSGTCREGGWKTKELEDMLNDAREVLKDEFED